MSDDILIRSKAIPSNPRSKNYPAGTTVVGSGGGGGSTVITGGGSSIDVLKVDDMRSLTDRNVFSSLRTISEILSRIIAKDDTDTELSDENTLSSLRTIKEIDASIESLKKLYLSKVGDDEAAGLIIFLKGLISEGLIEANGGLVVRKKELIESDLMSLVEESKDSLIEELKINVDPPGATTTLGGLTNVNDNADDTSETDDLLVRLAGSSEWSVNSNLFVHVSQLMTKVFPFTINLSGGGTFEKGSSQMVDLSWTYDQDISSQSVNGESLEIDIRAKQYAEVTADTTYILRSVCNGENYSKSVSIQFKAKKYYGVSDSDSLTSAQILALSNSWAQRAQGSTVFDCTGDKYPYYILPTSLSSGIQFWIGGLRNTDWVEEIREVTNAYGYTESYTIFRLNSIQTSALNIEVR